MDDIKVLSQLITGYSCDVQKGDNVFIMAEGFHSKKLVKQLIDDVFAKEANPFVDIIDPDIKAQLIMHGNETQMSTYGDYSLDTIKHMDVVIVIQSLENTHQYMDIPLDRMTLYNKNFMQKCFYGYVVPKARWIFFKYPTNAMAQSFNMSLAGFEKYYFDVCNYDYQKMSFLMDPLVERMNQCDRVKIISPGTDLEFSIKDITVLKSDGKNSIPDGEVFTAPVKNSANGHITFNCPVIFRGKSLSDIYFEIKDGKIVKAAANLPEVLNEILETDEGSRYLGEFAFGLNPKIKRPMKDILFDEKIGGSIHFAVGSSYYNASNGNQSLIHMDIVSIHQPEYGGGEIYFDDVLISKDGKFVTRDLKPLNNLKD